MLVAEPVSLLDGVALVPVADESAGAGVMVFGEADELDEPDAAGADEESGVVAVDDEVAGAGVLTGAESAGADEVAGVAGVSSLFLQPARAANTTAVANTVLRINIGPPCS